MSTHESTHESTPGAGQGDGGGPDTEDHPEWGEARERLVRWWDPTATALRGVGMSGIDYLGAIARGDLPPAPIAGLMGMELGALEVGRVSFTCVPDESAYNPIGAVHGGLVCTLLDSVCACALHSTLPLGRAYTSIEIKVSYLKAVTARSGRLTATGTVVRAGSRVGFTEGVVHDEAGTVVATATSTLLIFDIPGVGTPPADGGPARR